MDYKDKVTFVAAMLLAAKIQRGSAPDTATVRDAVKAAKALCEEIGD